MRCPCNRLPRRIDGAAALFVVDETELLKLLSCFADARDGIPETRSNGGTSVITWESALQMFLASKAIFHDGAERRLLVWFTL